MMSLSERHVPVDQSESEKGLSDGVTKVFIVKKCALNNKTHALWFNSLLTRPIHIN